MPLIAPDPDVVEVRPQRRRHPGLVVLGTVLVSVALVWGGFAAATGGDEADPPTPDPEPVVALSAAQKTALVWNEWSASTLESACLDEHGYDIAPAVLAYSADLSEVAALLTVHAVEPEGLAGYLPREGAAPVELLRGIDSGGCRVVRDLLDLDDPGVVDRLVGEAQADEGFRTYLAGALWVDLNGAVVLAAYLDLAEPSGGGVDDSWDGGAASAALADAVALAQEATSWTVSVTSAGAEYAQASGQSASGAVIALRVEPLGSAHRRPILWGSPEYPVVCGDLQVSLSMGEVLINYDGPQRGDVFDIRDVLAEQWCQPGVAALDGDETRSAREPGAAGAEQQ